MGLIRFVEQQIFGKPENPILSESAFIRQVSQHRISLRSDKVRKYKNAKSVPLNKAIESKNANSAPLRGKQNSVPHSDSMNINKEKSGIRSDPMKSQKIQI